MGGGWGAQWMWRVLTYAMCVEGVGGVGPGMGVCGIEAEGDAGVGVEGGVAEGEDQVLERGL